MIGESAADDITRSLMQPWDWMSQMVSQGSAGQSEEEAEDGGRRWASEAERERG